MTYCHELAMSLDGLEGIRFLITRQGLSSNGDVESAFLSSATEIKRHPSGLALCQILSEAADRPDCRALVLIRNPDLVLDPDLPKRIAAGIAKLPGQESWAVAAAGGLGLSDTRHLALYASQRPAIPSARGAQPLLDPMPDLTIVNAHHAVEVLARNPSNIDTGLETILAHEGYLAGRLSIFLPELVAGIDGDLMGRDLNRLRQSLNAHFGDRLAGQSISTLTGSVAIEPTVGSVGTEPVGTTDAAAALVARNCSLPGLSIVVRTMFGRPHLLRRLLTSISRARRASMPLEVVLSSDAPFEVCEGALSTLRTEFPNLDLRLCHSKPNGHSRVTNLCQGLRAARLDYVSVIDDDDYLDLFAFDSIAPAFFLGNRPVVIASSAVHEEVWENTNGPRATLAQSTQVNSYPAARWTEMFGGVNKLPVCAVIAPRNFVCRRLDAMELTHDLSEDYALFLMLLTAPDLPTVHEVAENFCHISLRGTENSVGMEDRRPWVRDIAGHLAALTANTCVTGAGMWQQLSAHNSSGPMAGLGRAVVELNEALAARDREIRLLRIETHRLRATLSAMEDPVA